MVASSHVTVLVTDSLNLVTTAPSAAVTSAGVSSGAPSATASPPTRVTVYRVTPRQDPHRTASAVDLPGELK